MKVAVIHTLQRTCLIGTVDGDVSGGRRRGDILVDNIHLLSTPT